MDQHSTSTTYFAFPTAFTQIHLHPSRLSSFWFCSSLTSAARIRKAPLGHFYPSHCRNFHSSRSRHIACTTDSSLTTDHSSVVTVSSPTRAAYVHIPFCRRRCFYCDFAVQAVGDAPLMQSPDKSSKKFNNYTDLVVREIHAAAKFNEKKFKANPDLQAAWPSLESIYFGGGTPSLLDIPNMKKIIDTLRSCFGISEKCEITIEMDPGTFDSEKASAFKDLGMNRASIGAQSFNNDILKKIGRAHNVDDIYQALETLSSVGVDNLSLDLMGGLPDQTLEIFQDSLDRLIKINPAHVSMYDLIVEDKTKFSRLYTPGEPPLPTEEAAADMYRQAVRCLTQAGYHHYEVSNYGKPGYESVHNQVYWRNEPYYGFGMSATSFMEGKRYSRPRLMSDYIKWVHKYESDENAIDIKPQTTQDELEETLMLGLRTSQGLDLEHLVRKFGEENANKTFKILSEFESLGLVSGDNSRIRLTDPEGFLLQNTILSTLFCRLEGLF